MVLREAYANKAMLSVSYHCLLEGGGGKSVPSLVR